jgi:hypothetical protein
MLSAFIVAWFSTGALFALFESIEDEEVQTLFRQNFSTAYMVVFQEAIVAFTLTYIIAKQLINKKTNKWLWRIIWYIVTDIVLFFALCLI